MPINHIALKVIQPDIESPLEGQARRLTLQGHALEQQQRIKEIQDQEQIQQIYQQHVAQGGDPNDLAALAPKIMPINPKLGADLWKQVATERAAAARAKHEEEVAKAQRQESKLKQFQIVSGLMDNLQKLPPDQRPQAYEQLRGMGFEDLPPYSDELAGLIGKGVTAVREGGLHLIQDAEDPEHPGQYGTLLTNKAGFYPRREKSAGGEKTGSDYHQFLARFAKSKNKSVDDLTDKEELEARKQFGRADDAAQRPWAPVVIQTPTGYQQVDRASHTATPITAGGVPVPQAPTSEMRNRGMAFETAKPILQSIGDLSEKINTQNGVIAKISGAVEKKKAQLNLNNDVAEYEALIQGFTPLIGRALGHTGVLTQQDVESVKDLFPKPGDSKSLRDRKIARLDSMIKGIQAANDVYAPPPAGARSPQPNLGGMKPSDKKPTHRYNPATGKIEAIQ
jgi:hypothetical protein